MTLPRNTYVTINAVDVTSYVISWDYKREFEDDISTIDVQLSSKVSAAIALTEQNLGDELIIKRGATTGQENFIFKGEVRSVNPGGAILYVTGSDKLFEAVRMNVTKSFDKNIDSEAGVISEIFKTLINDYTSLTADSTSVQNSGTTNVITKFICNNADVFERITKLAETLNWQFYYRADTDLVYFEQKGFVQNGTELTVGSDIVEVPRWSYDAEQLANRVKVIGAEQEVETTEQFDGTGAQTAFVLTYTPVSVKIEVDSVLQVGGKEGSTSGSYDYEVDEENKTINFVAGSIPGSGTNNVDIFYSYMLPAPVIGKRASSVETYGEHSKTLFKDELKTMDDAKTYMNKYLDEYGEPFVNTKLKMYSATDVIPGETIRVIDNANNIDKTVIVQQVTMKYPYKYDEVTVGDKILLTSDWMVGLNDRVRRLEEKGGRSQDLLLHVIDQFREDTSFKRRYFKFKKQTIDTDGLIIGHPVYGIIGTGIIGQPSSAATTTRIVQGNNIYKEYVYDNDFNDTGTTTGTWNNSTNTITLLTTEIAQTTQITVGTQYSTYKVSLGDVTNNANLTIEISGNNGSNWETVTQDVTTTFTNTDDTGVLLKMTASGATVTITNTTDSYGIRTAPTISVTLTE